MTYLQLYRDQVEEVKRANLVNEAETHRHNVVSEQLQAQGLSETRRTNKANEAIRLMSAQETIRSNLANEQIKQDTLAETMTHNRQMEQLEYIKRANEMETNDINKFKAEEEKRSNMAQEQIKQGEVDVRRGELALKDEELTFKEVSYGIDTAGKVIDSLYQKIIKDPRDTFLGLINALRGKSVMFLTGGN